MGNDPREAELIVEERIGFVAAELEALARTLRQCQEVAKSQENQSLAIYYWASAETGLKRVASFVRAADESRRQAVLGKPLKPGQLKPRSTAKKSAAETAEEARLDKLEASNEKHQAKQDAKKKGK